VRNSSSKGNLPLGLFMLTKPRLTLFSVMTAMVAYAVATGKSFAWFDMLHLFIGAYLVGGACAALNMHAEQEHDSIMNRTKNRPIPSGTVSTKVAMFFGYGIWVLGSAILYSHFNLLTALIGAATVVSYVWVYTPLKRKSTLNTLVGCLPGALPLALGWAASGVEFTFEAWSLFAILFLWQMPHFLSLAWVYRNDYQKAGYKMLPSIDPTGKKTGLQILLYTALLLVISLMPYFLKFNGKIYLIISAITGVLFIKLCFDFYKNGTGATAQKLFRFSLIYLPIIYSLILLDLR